MKNYIPLSGLSLRDIEYVVAVDDLRNFSRAAERCGVSQAGLSEQVRKLENLLGISLFERSRRHVTPTSDGQKIIPLCREVMTNARSLLEAARAHTGPLDGELSIAVIPTIGPYLLPSLIPKIRQKYPDLILRLAEKQTAVLCRALREGHIDIGIIASLPLPDTITEMPLFKEPFYAVFPNNHKLAKKKIVSIEDLNHDDLLLLEEGHCLREQAMSLCNTQVKNEKRLATSLEMLYQMIAVREGFSLIPSLALENRSEMQKLTEVRKIREPEAERTISLIWRQCDPRGEAFSKFGEFIRSITPKGCIKID